MPVRKKTSTTRLPQTLREELDESVGNHHPRRKWQAQGSRKEARKQERAVRKQNKAEFFSTNAARHKRPAEEDHEESPQRKKTKHEKSVISATSGVPQSVGPKNSKDDVPEKPLPSWILKTSKKTRTALEKLTGGSKTIWAPTVQTRKEEEEDSYIAYLESKLGYTKGKKKTVEDDGLDDLLDLATSLAEPTQKSYEIDTPEDLESEDDGDSEDESFEEWSGIINSGNDYDKEMGDSDDGLSESEGAQTTTPGEQAEASTRYIPPHLRRAQRENQEASEDTIKLTRHLKGLLNRMSEQNMSGILDKIEEIYRNHRRNDVTSNLTRLIIDGIASHSSLLDSYVVMYAAFVASLHKIIGIEFAAHFIQNVVSLYEKYYGGLPTSSQEIAPEAEVEANGKECSNLIVLLSELYNFQVISSVLVFDIIRRLLTGDLTEFGVELLLKIVRNSGQQLRQDDPSALKDIIQIVQDKVSDKSDDLSSRTRFMIETLTNLKNNKLKRNTTQNQGGEAVERMKKFLTGLTKKRHVLAHEPLRASLEDLHSVETKGKWWLVGAAWGGDPLVDRQATTKVEQTVDEISNNSLLKLARKQGMNTDIRRSIFVVLMSSDDYVDACERLSQLNLNEIQQREIVRVILHCCGNEKTYNPYYTLVCQHLCRSSHSYKITLQFCLWDFFRDLGETSVGGAQVIKTLQDHEDEGFDSKKISKTRVRNVAKAYAWWIAKDCVNLTVLKPVNFTNLKPQSQEFLHELLVQIFIGSQVTTPVFSNDLKNLPLTWNRGAVEEIFIKATRIQDLAMGLVYFMLEAFRELSEDEGGIAKLIKWANGVGKDTLRTGVDIVPNL